MRFKSISLIVAGAVFFMMLSSSAAFAGRRIGDCNDDVNVNVGDVVYLINYLYRGGDAPSPKCVGDCNVDCSVNVGDVVFLVNYLYRHGDLPGTPSGGAQKGMVYGYITYTHINGGVPGTKVWSSASPCINYSEPLDNDCQSLYCLSCVETGNQTINCQDTADLNSPTVSGNVNVVVGELVQLDMALYPTTDLVISGSQVCYACGNQGNSYPYGITNLHWTRGCHKYVLDGPGWICDGQTLVIDPGVVVYGRTGQPTTYLAVQQGGKIIADGQPCMPIVLTSNAGAGNRQGGDWGGLIIAGYAKNNTGCHFSEGDAAWFGCECDPPCVSHSCDPHENSGVLRYFRVEFAGVELGPDNELNGIAMYGVGDGTHIDYVQVHRNYDDGIEWFGGTNNCKHVLISECWDDHFDWTDGAQFKAQFVALRGYGGSFPGVGKWGDRLIEADNQEFDFNLSPRSRPVVLNVTTVGGKEVRYSGAGAPVSNSENIKMRHGTAGQIYNLICMDASKAGLDLQHTNYFAFTPSGTPSYWPNGTINRDSIDVDYAIWYNNGYTSAGSPKNGIEHWKDRASIWGWHNSPGNPQYSPDSMSFDGVALCDPYLPHSGDAWVSAGLYTNAKYNHPHDPGIQVSLPDNGTGNYNPMLIAPREAFEVSGNLPDFRPQAGSPALNSTNAMPAGHPIYSDPFFQYVPYVGAFDIGSAADHVNDWTYPWSAWPDN